MEMIRARLSKAKTSRFPLDTFSSGASLEPGKRRHLPLLPFRVNKRNDALCHLRTIPMTEKRPLMGAKRSRRKTKRIWDLHKRAIMRTFKPFFGWIDAKKVRNVPSANIPQFEKRLF